MTETLDCRGMMCPMPIFQLVKRIKAMKVGEEVTMISDDIISKADVPAWCQRTGNELVEATEEDGIFTYRIRKSK
jgi:tRNA 2-thiouridine synthesizing protein A